MGSSVTPRTLVELGFPAVQQALAERTSTPRGRAQALALALLDTRGLVVQGLERLEEARGLLRDQERLPLGGIDDVAPQLLKAQKGAVLGPEELLAVARLMRAAAEVRSFLRARRSALPQLMSLAEGLVDLSPVASRITYAIDPSGQIKDEASEQLQTLRRRSRTLHGDIRGRVEGLLRDSTFATYLQDSYVSLRNDRYVVPVNVQFRAKVPGIVHNASQTGMTLFIEPQALLELGNELAISEAMAAEEERRILTELSESVADHERELSRGLDVLGDLDLVQASAQLALDMNASRPEPVEPTADLSLKALRHPLLVLQKKAVVPNDVRLEAAQRALVVSGPNAGGKTVTITGLALVSLMARAGLYVPAEPGAKVPLFDGVASTIGDRQNLERDLSTFSAHMKSLSEVLAVARDGWLVVVDEIAADTDPQQGAALARAILDELLERGARVLVTTHLDEVKALGVTDPRYVNARVGLHEGSLLPTYRLELGAAGGSSALAMAARMGLPERVLERAAASLKDSSLLSQAIDRLEQAERRAQAAQEEAATEKARLDEESAALRLEQQNLATARRELELRLRQEMAPELEARREEVRRLIAELQGAPSITTAQKAQKRIEELQEEEARAQARLQHAPQEKPNTPVVAGAWVHVVTLGKDGKVLDLDDKHAVVEVGTLRTRVKLADLVPRQSGPPPKPKEARRSAGGAAALVTPAAKCDVRGMRADDAMASIEAFLDRCFLEGPSQVVLVHGHGTGVLKHLIREALEKSPYVERFRPGDRHEGGDGATVVDLRQA